MAFSDDTIIQAWVRAGGRCECQRNTHDHTLERCPRRLNIANRGRQGEGAWVAHHVIASDGDRLSNCELLCWPCHAKTQKLGGLLS